MKYMVNNKEFSSYESAKAYAFKEAKLHKISHRMFVQYSDDGIWTSEYLNYNENKITEGISKFLVEIFIVVFCIAMVWPIPILIIWFFARMFGKTKESFSDTIDNLVR